MYIAELSANHNGSLERAKALIKAASDANATHVKLQTFKAQSMTLKHEGKGFVINDPRSLWHGCSLYELYAQGATPYSWHQPLFDYAASLGLTAFSSPFDEAAVDFLESIQCPLYKVASFEITHIPLLQRIAETGKPVIVSTGMATTEDIQLALATLKQYNAGEVTLLKCTSNYPADASEANLATLGDMAVRFGCKVGLSDHTLGIGVAIAATALGAEIIEKHFILKRKNGGLDAEFSMEPAEFKQMVAECERAKAAVGQVQYGGSEREQEAKLFRRSIYFKASAKKGDVVDEQLVQVVRPALGLHPKYFQSIIGTRLLEDVSFGEPVSWSLLEAGENKPEADS